VENGSSLSLLANQLWTAHEELVKKNENIPDWCQPGSRLVMTLDEKTDDLKKLTLPAMVEEISNGLITISTPEGYHLLRTEWIDKYYSRIESGNLTFFPASLSEEERKRTVGFYDTLPKWQQKFKSDGFDKTMGGLFGAMGGLFAALPVSIFALPGPSDVVTGAQLAAMGILAAVGAGAGLGFKPLRSRMKRRPLKQLETNVNNWKLSVPRVEEHSENCQEIEAELVTLRFKRDSFKLGYEELKRGANFRKLEEVFSSNSKAEIEAKRNAVLYSEAGLLEEYESGLEKVEKNISELEEQQRNCQHFIHNVAPEWMD